MPGESNELLSQDELDSGLSPMGGGYLLADVTRLMRAAFDDKMQELGLTASTWRVLIYLHRSDGVSQAALARQLEVSRASLGQMIDRLEQSGHVMRAEHSEDRRVWCVHLTAKALAMMPDVESKAKSLHALSFGKLAPKDYKKLLKILLELRDILVTNESAA
ncbi:MarR family winged helix-turn-helix transcriptional regulator [Phenylobacterium sp. CCH9-H3]|jgi:MarR family transcriptional regulator, transcriptional regulator for hemolysin|uniref:MarR family winged helix-turn-helix transcriptional regulator n=1 Tax=Phenylobacterium sp. CCH9-H3 TaxID=1768774 RepID=UPI00083A5CAB|nr:MarR family transcriptional regulator [Phenylobacterium sp. CCH9-H3]